MVQEHQTQLKCDSCRALLAVERDGDRVDGVWTDTTKLVLVGVSLND